MVQEGGGGSCRRQLGLDRSGHTTMILYRQQLLWRRGLRAATLTMLQRKPLSVSPVCCIAAQPHRGIQIALFFCWGRTSYLLSCWKELFWFTWALDSPLPPENSPYAIRLSMQQCTFPLHQHHLFPPPSTVSFQSASSLLSVSLTLPQQPFSPVTTGVKNA